MTLHIEMYIPVNNNWVEFHALKPGTYAAIPNDLPDGGKELYRATCEPDDLTSTLLKAGKSHHIPLSNNNLYIPTDTLFEEVVTLKHGEVHELTVNNDGSDVDLRLRHVTEQPKVLG